MDRVSLKIEGMSCGHCVRAVREALDTLDGVEVETVEVGSASVRYDPAHADAARIARAVEEAGYPVRGSEDGS
jgi:copper chaperone